jgi:nitroreductase
MSERGAPIRLPVERWSAALSGRRSRRSYDDRPIEAPAIEALRRHCDEFRPFPDARAVLIPDAPPDLYRRRRDDPSSMGAVGDAFVGIVGSYGRITGAPSAIAFVASASSLGTGGRSVSGEAQLGYTGQGAVLEATALGLDTCWVGGFFSPGTTKALIGGTSGEVVLAVTPVGHAQARLSGRERHFFRMGRPKKRLQLSDIAPSSATGDWPEWALAGLRTTRSAPSAVNRQPWRFRLDDRGVVIACDAPDRGGISRRIDCGIAMLHFELGALHAGARGSWEHTDLRGDLDVARWRLSDASRPA